MVTWERGFECLGSFRWFQEMTFVSENDVYKDRYMQRNKHVAHEASFLLNGILMY